MKVKAVRTTASSRTGSAVRRPAPVRFFLFLFAAVLLSVLLRGPFYLRRQIFNVDEGTLAAVATTILDGGLPYLDSWDTRGPLTFYLYAGVFAVAGRNNMLAVHGVTVLAAVLTSLFLMLAGRWLGEGWAADLAGPVYAIVSFTYLKMDMLAANIEIFMVVFVSAGFCLAALGLRPWRPRFIFASGLCLGAAFLTKQPALLDWAGLTVVLLAWGGEDAPGLRRRAGAALASAAGFLLPVGLVAGWYAHKGAFAEFLFGFWTYSSRYFIPAMDATERLLMVVKGPWPLLRDNPYAWLSALVSAAVLIVSLARRRWRAGPLDLVWVWAATSFAGASASGRGFGHYYIQLLPPLALLSALFSARFLPAAAGRLSREGIPRRLAVGGVVLAALAGYFLPLTDYFKAKHLGLLAEAPAVLAESIATRNERAFKPVIQKTARYLRKNSAPDDRIFVWGFYPQLYVLADRGPATRFSYCIYLTGLVPWVNTDPREDTSRFIVPGSWDLLMGDLERNRPPFVVDTSPGDIYFWGKYPPADFPRLAAFLARDYRLAREMKNSRGEPVFRIYRRTAP